MKKILYTITILLSIIILLYIPRSEKLQATEIQTEITSNKTYQNRTVQALVKQYETDKDLLRRLEEFPLETPIIESNGGFFGSYMETKETYTVETWNEDGTEVIFVEGDAATVGEVIEAIKNSEKQ
ncbi:TPA: hypothetical protein ACGO0F_002155 [Streptococcus suis]